MNLYMSGSHVGAQIAFKLRLARVVIATGGERLQLALGDGLLSGRRGDAHVRGDRIQAAEKVIFQSVVQGTNLTIAVVIPQMLQISTKREQPST